MSKTNLRISFASNNILHILTQKCIILILREKCLVFSYPGYTETRKTQLVKNSNWSIYVYLSIYLCLSIRRPCVQAEQDARPQGPDDLAAARPQGPRYQGTGYQWIQPVFCRAGEPANFLAAPAPDFFPKLLRLLVFFSSGSGS